MKYGEDIISNRDAGDRRLKDASRPRVTLQPLKCFMVSGQNFSHGRYGHLTIKVKVPFKAVELKEGGDGGVAGGCIHMKKRFLSRFLCFILSFR